MRAGFNRNTEQEEPMPLTARHLICASAVVAAFAGAAPAVAKTCAEEMPEIKASIEAMTHNADFNVAEHQYQKAQERLAAGKENSCLRYLESARSAIQAANRHNDD